MAGKFAMRCDRCGARFTHDTDDTAEFKLRWHLENTHGVNADGPYSGPYHRSGVSGTYTTVNCHMCRKEFCASTVEIAMKLLREHQDREHYRERVAYEELKLTAWDKRFLDWCGIPLE